ncbi:SlyX family protein [Alteromonas sediminis]|uniref:Protein SlyX homolog n=2 Tax=Alteromonas sediminis TaxID=2259342 RepID=A0A3N5Y1H9_9ALTE|nr:SlyX family protein [Alteromonas sediminis]
MTHADMQRAIEELEVKVAYQEHTIDSLNDEVTRQNKHIEQLSFQLRQVVEKLKGMEPSHIAKQSEEAPPPHY